MDEPMTDLSNLTDHQRRRLSGVPLSAQGIYLRAIAGRATRQGAIKAMCMECMGYDRPTIANCPSTACPLHPFRPFQKKRAGATEPPEA